MPRIGGINAGSATVKRWLAQLTNNSGNVNFNV